jgi:hypothetical protein
MKQCRFPETQGVFFKKPSHLVTHRPLEKRASSALSLNFLRNKFFPSLLYIQSNFTKESAPLLTLSLGLLAKSFGLKKSLKSSKQNYLSVASFLKRTLIYIGNHNIDIIVKGVPKYVKDIFSTIFGRSDKILTNPFTDKVSTDSFLKSSKISFSKVYFVKPYDYSNLKVKKKGKPKRKIAKKLYKVNNVID